MTTETPHGQNAGWMNTLDEYLVKRAPVQIPEGGKELIVRFGPWISLVLMLVTLPLVLGALGLGLVLAPLGGVAGAAGFGLSAVFAIAQVALLVVALPGLFKRKISAWTLLVYEQLVSFVGAVLAGSVIGSLVGLLIGLYILFQVREKYS